jgi:hypothetical protein
MSNCLLECFLFSAQEALAKATNETCMPWYFPFPDGSAKVCDPWQAAQFYQFMVNDNQTDNCSWCLPDCVNTVYHPVVTALPFKTCDETNLGVSPLCNIYKPDLPQPMIWAEQVKKELEGRRNPAIASNERVYSRSPVHFTKLDTKYNAYERDLAMLHVFFDKPSVFQVLIWAL